MMTERERQLAILDGKPPDRIPWVPRLEIWYTGHYLHGTLPEEFKGMRLRDIQKALGVATTGRTGKVFTSRIRGVEIIERRAGTLTTTEYVTPVGTITETRKRSVDLDRAGIGGLVSNHLIKRPEDYGPLMYMFENTEYYPTYEEFEAYDRDIGDDGLPMVRILEVPFNDFLFSLAGYEKAYMDLFDYPDKVEQLLKTMEQVYRERMWPIVANSSARLLTHGSHFDSEMTPANLYDQYMTPYIREFTDYMHRHGKTVAQHADNDCREIMDQLSESGYDMQECFTTAPLVSLTLKEARKKWGNSMILFGGIPSTMLEESVPEEEFEDYLDDLFKTIAPGDAFILGVADNATMTSKISRIRRITEMVEERGRYPIAA